MSASPEVIHPKNVTEVTQGWKVMPLVRKDSGKGSSCTKVTNGDASSSGDECNTKVRKPYTITKQRERWTENEHQKFLEALKLYGRAWRRIEEYIGTKTAVQIRSHAQKFFSKLERKVSTGSPAGKVQDIEIPPPRPKRKPSLPYPKKAGHSPVNPEDENKEPSSLSSAGLAAVHHEGFQSGSFNPYITKGLGSAFHRNPLLPGHFFGPQGSVKLFGKTVAVPKSVKPASRNNSGKECLFNGESPFPSTQANKADLQQTSGFSPFSKVRKDENLSEEPLHLDRNGSYLVINPSKGLRELHAKNCSDGLAATNESGAADCHFLSEGEDHQQGGSIDVRNIENTFALPHKECAKLDVQFSHGAHQNHSVHHWTDNFFRYHSGLSLPPMARHSLTDGVSNNPLAYWQFMQVSAVNYAAYTAAMAAAAATGWTGSIAGHEESTETSRANVSEAQVLSSLGNDLNPTALPSAATSWWPFKGFMPLGYSCPMGAVYQAEQLDTAANDHPLEYGKKDADLEVISSQGGELTMDFETADEAETSEQLDEDGKTNHTENSPSAMLGTSCVTKATVSEIALPDSESQHEMDAMIVSAKCCTQESDSESRVAIESPQSLYSSSDEFEGQVKKQGEGSSSGSNTPASRCQLSECDALTMLESKKRDSYSLSEDYDDMCSDAFKKSHHLCGIPTMESPKVRVKHAEKGSKLQQKDSRHGGSDNPKRLKSCALEIELRKAVSQEGRKAFRALFTSKLLPQTFPAANMVEGSDMSFTNEHVSRPSVSKKESDLIYVPAPMEEASGECLNPDGSPEGEVNEEILVRGNFSRTSSANFDEQQHKGNSKSFTISLRSGFVPYRRLAKDS